MITTATIDLSGLQRLVNGLQWALLGTGREGDAATVLADEAAKLALECASQVSAKTKAKAERKLSAQIRGQFLAAPSEMFTGHQAQGHGMTWLYAGPNFLAGARPEDVQLDLTAGEMKAQTAANPGNRTGNAWVKLGTRGKQSVLRMNRIVVRRRTLKEYRKLVSGRLGRMKATFADGAVKIAATIGKRLSVPKWISRHFGVSDLSALLDLSGLGQVGAPNVAFGSAAKGVAKQSNRIARAVKTREYKIRKRLELILSGYAQDVHAGHAPRRHAAQTATEPAVTLSE